MKIKLICQYCKKVFYRIPSRSWATKPGDYGKVHKKYCSPTCAHNYLLKFWNSPTEKKARSIRAMGEGNGRWIGGLLKCVDCGKTLSLRQGLLRCLKCNGKISSQIYIGEKARNWRGGKTLLRDKIRGLDKTKEWRIAVFTRDNFTCQVCGKSHTYLEAHHIKEFTKLLSVFLNKYKQFSIIKHTSILLKLAVKYKPFWNIANGKTLCLKCHNKTKHNY